MQPIIDKRRRDGAASGLCVSLRTSRLLISRLLVGAALGGALLMAGGLSSASVFAAQGDPSVVDMVPVPVPVESPPAEDLGAVTTPETPPEQEMATSPVEPSAQMPVPAGPERVEDIAETVAQARGSVQTGLEGMARDYQLRTILSPDLVQPDDLRSLFYTAWQYALLIEARDQLNTRPPSEEEMRKELSESAAPPVIRTGIRELSLGGIAYRSGKDWTIWLNGQRVTPSAIPSEIMDIKVSGQQVEMKWFDRSTNLVYPVRLRPHQRFNLDSRLFLPGTGTEQAY